jgi:glucuronate isomerase
MPVISDNFLLTNKTAQTLYNDYAKSMPIFDYHCHLSPKEIAENRSFDNLTKIWLNGDHYKWRAMRTSGVDEKFITGDADDFDKFTKWAETVPYTIKNPLYHWTHLELSRYFGIHDKTLNPSTARYIYDACSEKLRSEEFKVQNMIKNMNVKTVCTTDDPIDTLEHHVKIKNDGYEVSIRPTFRPDKGMAVDTPDLFNDWVSKLELISKVSITGFSSFIEAIRKRHDFFHSVGCRISDHGIETAYAEDYTDSQIAAIFDKVRAGKPIEKIDILKFKCAMMKEFAIMDFEKCWAQQLHFGAIRNNSTRMYKKLGPDTGFDAIGDFEIGKPLSKFLDSLDVEGKLPKTIIYNLNPKDNELIGTMIGCFQGGNTPGKIQFGSGWWFLDQKDGMEKQITALSNLGLLSRFIGMLTDSRSFLSYPRHEYFRRILCNILGQDMVNGEIFESVEFVGKIVQDICYNNAVDYILK